MHIVLGKAPIHVSQLAPSQGHHTHKDKRRCRHVHTPLQSMCTAAYDLLKFAGTLHAVQTHPWSAAEHQGDASNEAPAFTEVRGSGREGDHADPFMQEERLERQAAASSAAPAAASFEDPAFLEETSGGHAPEFRADSSEGACLCYQL